MKFYIRLSEIYKQKFGKTSIGKQMAQFNCDFDSFDGSVGNVYSRKLIALGKKYRLSSPTTFSLCLPPSYIFYFSKPKCFFLAKSNYTFQTNFFSIQNEKPYHFFLICDLETISSFKIFYGIRKIIPKLFSNPNSC